MMFTLLGDGSNPSARRKGIRKEQATKLAKSTLALMLTLSLCVMTIPHVSLAAQILDEGIENSNGEESDEGVVGNDDSLDNEQVNQEEGNSLEDTEGAETTESGDFPSSDEGETVHLLAEEEEEEDEPLPEDFTPPTLSGPTGDPNDAGSFGQISLVKYIKIANGCMGGMALDASGRVWSFGYNLYGQLGVGKTVGQQNYFGGFKRIPYFIDNGIKVLDIGSSYETRYALGDDGLVYAWGNGANGAMGNGTSILENTTPKAVPNLSNIAKIFVSDSYTGLASCFALAEDGTLYAWGNNGTGQLGISTGATLTTPQVVPLDESFASGEREVVKITLGRCSAHLIDSKGDLWTTGSDTYGEQGNGTGTGNGAKTAFTMMNRETTGMGRIVDVDTSYSLGLVADSVVACDEYGDAWEWGLSFGDAGAAGIAKQTPTKIIPSATEVAAYGYTPKALRVTASERVGYFIDQHGRPWGWGTGTYFGFGREGGYENSNDEIIPSTAAQQVPKIIGDGDTQVYDADPKKAIYAGGDHAVGSHYGYGFNALHPTIYDEKYMLKDKDGYVLDTEGQRLKLANAVSMDGVSGLRIGLYYKIDSTGRIIAPGIVGTPETDPVDALWINTAFKEVPYLVEMDCSYSAYGFLDADGNLYKWGYDGSGAVAWGWDYNSKYDPNGSLTAGLYDRYTYEVMYMRGAPSVDLADLMVGMRDEVKVYKDPTTGEVTNIIEVTLYLPATVASQELESDVHSDVADLKYVLVPYNKDDPNFNLDVSTLTQEQFMQLYDAADDSHKGDLVETPIVSGDEPQGISFEVNAFENCRLIAMAVDERYVNAPGGGREYERTDTVVRSIIVDNVYTPVSLEHKGIGIAQTGDQTQLYDLTTNNVVKTNDDSDDTKLPFNELLYGSPLNAVGEVIGASRDAQGNITVDPDGAPTYGYDTVQIKSYEAVSDVGLPSGIKPYWRFKAYLDDEQTVAQQQTVQKNMNDSLVHQAGFAYSFFYEQDPAYWTTIEGVKTWDDLEDALGFRPDSAQLTLKQFERDTTTGVKGDYIADIATITIQPNAQDVWSFSFGLQKSYEYTYEIGEVTLPAYSASISYPNLEVTTGTNEDFSSISIVNTLSIKPVRFNKVDTLGIQITLDSAEFEFTNSQTGGKVLNASGEEQDSLALVTTAGEPYVVVPIQRQGVYHLTEVKAPSGFNLLTLPIVITVDSGGAMLATLGSTQLQEASDSGAEGSPYAKVFNVVNKSASLIPAAGGPGASALLIIGLAAMFATAYLIVRRKENGGGINET